MQGPMNYEESNGSTFWRVKASPRDPEFPSEAEGRLPWFRRRYPDVAIGSDEASRRRSAKLIDTHQPYYEVSEWAICHPNASFEYIDGMVIALKVTQQQGCGKHAPMPFID